MLYCQFCLTGPTLISLSLVLQIQNSRSLRRKSWSLLFWLNIISIDKFSICTWNEFIQVIGTSSIYVNYIVFRKYVLQTGHVMHACDPNTQKSESGWFQVQGQSGWHQSIILVFLSYQQLLQNVCRCLRFATCYVKSQLVPHFLITISLWETSPIVHD
jgi:hypothetical protein